MTRSQQQAASVFTGDLSARRIIALARVAAALLIAGFASVQTLALPTWFAWLAGLVWLPIASWIWFAEEGATSRGRNMIAYGADLAVIGAMLWLVPDHASTIVVFSLPMAAAVTYRSGTVPGLTFGLGIVALRLAATHLGPAPSIEPALQIGEVTLLLCVTILIHRARSVQQRDQHHVRQFAKKSEMILTMSQEGVMVTDAGGTILQTNPAADRVLGDGSHALVGAHCDEVSLQTEAGPLDCRTTCGLAALCHDDQGVSLWRQQGDERQPLLASATRVDGPNGSSEFIHSFRDITRLRQADEAKTMFLATASHELKTPLTVIRGFTQVLLATIEDDRSKTALQAIESRSRELSSIVDRLLLSSRIESGRVELAFETANISDLLAHRLPQVGASLGRVIDLDVAEDLVIQTSPDALGTVVEHLLDNAAKYSPGGQPIAVRAAQDDGVVVIEISDQGIGMTADQVTSCFDKFWQAEATDVRRFGGTGIGLYIVSSLVRGLGGTVTVDSTPGQGSTFTVLLPVRQPDQPSDDQPIDAPITEPKTSVDDFMRHLGLSAGAN